MVAVFVLVVSLAASIRWLAYSRKLRRGWRFYTKDTFIGILWRWRYDSQGQIRLVVPYCVTCGGQLSYSSVSATHTPPMSWFDCAKCKTPVVFPLQSDTEVIEKVKYLVAQNLSGNTWRGKLDT
jgi:hypothetical protein